ncbi:MAG: T9SS type A sorting domain-containing protein, partial [Bacteroidetes bacterium]|nr:T9SS type A sorting domain-containing protein [Bacteroidota bacterium]
LFGKTIQSFELGITQADMFEVDLSNQAAGFYIIQMQNGNQVETKKVLLSK